MRPFLIFFVIWPLLELWLLVQVGHWIGALPVMALVLVSALLGIALLRSVGWQTLVDVRSRMQRMDSPAPALLDGIAVAIAGILLLLPGLISDIAAALLLVGPLRRRLLRAWQPPLAGTGPMPGGVRPDYESVIIEGEYHREEGESRRQSDGSVKALEK